MKNYQKITRISDSRLIFLVYALILYAFIGTIELKASDPHVKPRVIATTDGEVDDRSSMIRFLVSSCDYDVMGIVQVNSKFQKDGHSRQKWIEAQIDKYETLLSNLRIHNPDYPDADSLRSVIRVGNENWNDLYVPPPEMATQNTPGEQLIIQTLLDDDPRPVHVLSWGGANTTASALWRLKYSGDYTTEQFDYAVSRIRIYCIWYQDGGGQWIEDNVKEAYINEAYRWDNVWDYQSTGSTNPPEQRAYMTSDWLKANVKFDHGSLGAMYPQTYVSEGDTPSFLHLINNGLESQNDYTLGGWGGRSAYDDPINKPNHVTDDFITDDRNRNKMYWRWIIPAQNDFAARMDWCVASSYSAANHQPVAQIVGSNVRTVEPGETISLDASPTTDPDGNQLSYSWWQYYDADDATSKVTINNPGSISDANFVVPDERGKQVHIILEVTDDGDPPLQSYQRIIFNISKGPEYYLTTSVIGQGSISPSGGTYYQGDVVTLTAKGDLGWAFNHWSGDASGSDNPLSLTIDGDKSVTATFVQVPTYTLTSSVIGNGSISPSSGTYSQGDVVSITAIPDAGWQFDYWGGDLSGNSNPVNLTIDANKTITATFSEPSRPSALINLGFNENSGTTVANTGSVSATFTKTNPPAWSTNVPVNGGASSVDFGTRNGNYYVESDAVISELTGLSSFTVTGWINNRSYGMGSGGNRIVSWIKNGGNGVDIVYISDGSLQVGINQWPDGSVAKSSTGKIPTSSSAPASNWRFFAVTYEASARSLKFYFGDNTTPASLDKTITYNRGKVGTNIGKLAVGHFNAESQRTSRTDRLFKGLIDQVEIFDSALWLAEIQIVQNIGGVSVPITEQAIVPSEFKLYPAYPNPFNPETKITFSVPHPARINISVFDVTGRIIRTLFNQEVSTGEFSLTWDASGLASGVYFIRLNSGNFSAISKCTLVK